MNNRLISEFKKSFPIEVPHDMTKSGLAHLLGLQPDHPLVNKLANTYFVNDHVTINIEIKADEYADGTWLVREVNIKR